MKILVLIIIVIFALCVSVYTKPPVTVSIPCLWTNPVTNKQYDLTALQNSTGSYTWNSVWNGVTYTWQVQFCANVANPINAACNIPAPAYQYDPEAKTCVQLGDITCTSFDLLPSQNGVMITYYHGAYTTSVTSKLARLYVECDSNGNNQLTFEHERNCTYGDQFHFTISTPFIC